MPSLIMKPSSGEPFMNDWPTIVFDQRDDLAVFDRAAQPMHEERPVIAAAEIVLARPDQLDRPVRAERLGGRGQFGDEMRCGLRAAAEAAAGQHGLDLHLLGLAGRARRRWSPARRSGTGCRTAPAPSAVEAQIAVERLHRRMGEIGKDIFRLDHLAGLGEAPHRHRRAGRRPCRASAPARDNPGSARRCRASRRRCHPR